MGDAFGELALLQNSTRTATIVCKTACEFLKIDREDFKQVNLATKEYWFKPVSLELNDKEFLAAPFH